MFDPHLYAVDVYVAPAAGLAECEVFSLLHLLMAHAADLIRLQLHPRNGFLPLRCCYLVFLLIRRGRGTSGRGETRLQDLAYL